MAFLRRMLWLDDDIQLIEVTKPFFEEKGFEVVSFSNFDDAESEIRKHSFDCYLVDLDLGCSEASGIDFIKLIRQDDMLTPIFVFSAYLEEPFWKSNLEEHKNKITGVFTKPLPIIGHPEFDNFFFLIESSVFKSLHKQLTNKYGHHEQIDNLFNAKQSEKKTCFALMPFSDPFNLIYKDHIKNIVEKYNFVCVRADEIYDINPIIEDIIKLIISADVLIVDLTTKNPNVFYELGIAHAIEKPTILITQSMADVPFDVPHIRCIKYDYTPPGMKTFEQTLKRTLDSLISQKII